MEIRTLLGHIPQPLDLTVDTIYLMVDNPICVPSSNLPILPNKVDPTTGEEIENTVLYTTPDGEEKVVSYASYKSNNDILTVKINKRGMKIELSLAWFLNNKRNIIHLTPIEAKEAFERLQGELESEIGLKSNILDAKFARLDLAREIKTDKPLREYVPLFSNREYYRSKKKRFDDTHYIGNNSHTIAIYDKKNHLVHKGKDVSDLPDNFIRFEYRLYNKDKCKAVIGDKTVSDIINNWHSLEKIFNQGLRYFFFKEDPFDFFTPTVDNEKDRLIHHKNTGNNYWYKDYVELAGYSEVLRKFGSLEKFEMALKEVFGKGSREPKKKINRYLKLRNQYPSDDLKSIIEPLYAEIMWKLFIADGCWNYEEDQENLVYLKK